MHKDYEINHRTKKVKYINGDMGPSHLVTHNADKNIYVIYTQGSKFYGGLGRPQSYAQAKVSVYQPQSVINIDNERQVIRVGDPLISWLAYDQKPPKPIVSAK